MGQGAEPEIGFAGAPLLSSICFVFLGLPAKLGSFGKIGMRGRGGSLAARPGDEAKCPKLDWVRLVIQGARRGGAGPAAWPAATARCVGGCAFLTYFYCRTEIPAKQT